MGWVSLNPDRVVFVGSPRPSNKGADWLLSARRVRIVVHTDKFKRVNLGKTPLYKKKDAIKL